MKRIFDPPIKENEALTWAELEKIIGPRKRYKYSGPKRVDRHSVLDYARQRALEIDTNTPELRSE